VTNINQKKLNAYIMAMYIFQFGFLQPIASLVNSQIPIAGFTILLFIALLLNNKFRIKTYVIIAFILISAYFLLSSLFLALNTASVLMLYLEFLIKGFSAFIVASITVDSNEIYKAFLNISVINFVSIAAYPISSFLDSMNYMRFGYAMVPSVIMFFYATIDSKFKNPLWVLFAISSLFLTLVYGSRGPIVVIFLFLLISFVFANVNRIKKILLVCISTILLFFIVNNNILLRIADYIYHDMGISTYSLTKIRVMLTKGIMASSSGRDVIYNKIVDLIQLNPYFGYGIGFININWDTTAHNIILQILIECGIFGLVLWLIIWVFCINKYAKMSLVKDKGLFRVTTLIIAIAFGRLLISSDMWLRPEYWFVLSLLLGFNYETKRNIPSRMLVYN
jgi:O-antigen ligase